MMVCHQTDANDHHDNNGEEEGVRSTMLSFICEQLTVPFQRKGVVTSTVATMEVDVLPPTIPPLPNSCLLRLLGVSVSLLVQRLGNFDVANGGSVISQ